MPPSPSPPLGALISEHKCGRWVLVVAGVVGPLLLLGGPGLAAALFVFPERRPLGATITLATFALGAAALGGWAIVVGQRKKHTRILLYEGGIVETVRQKRRELTWEDIASFKYITIATGAYVVTQLTIVPKEGRRWQLNSQHVLGLEAIANRLAGEVTDLTLPDMRRRLAAGERVDFGKLALSAEGIHKKRRILPWGEVAGVWVHLGHVRVLRHGDVAATLVVNGAQLERMDALLTLIRENCRREPAHAPFVVSTRFRQLMPKLVLQTLFAVPMAAFFFGAAGVNLRQAFRSLGEPATNHYGSTLSPLGLALLCGTVGVLFAGACYVEVLRPLRQQRLAVRLAKHGKLVPVMVLENKFDDWNVRSGWRYRYLTPRGVEAADRIDVGAGGAATWTKNKPHLVALCSDDERESVLITMSGYPLARLPATSRAGETSPS